MVRTFVLYSTKPGSRSAGGLVDKNELDARGTQKTNDTPIASTLSTWRSVFACQATTTDSASVCENTVRDTRGKKMPRRGCSSALTLTIWKANELMLPPHQSAPRARRRTTFPQAAVVAHPQVGVWFEQKLPHPQLLPTLTSSVAPPESAACE